MATFLIGVVVGWAATFAMWFGLSFGFVSGLMWGTLIGTATLFVLAVLQWALQGFNSTRNHSEKFTWFKAH